LNSSKITTKQDVNAMLEKVVVIKLNSEEMVHDSTRWAARRIEREV
jgi:hypothetical protein